MTKTTQGTGTLGRVLRRTVQRGQCHGQRRWAIRLNKKT